jgi:hypothetical protein
VVVASNQVIVVAYVAPAADVSDYMASNFRLERLAWRCLPDASLGLLPALACRAPCSAYTRERRAAAGSFSCTRALPLLASEAAIPYMGSVLCIEIFFCVGVSSCII